MSNYNQVRSFNVGIAEETSVTGALIYDDLAYAQQQVGKDRWFYRSYEQLLKRFPMYSEQTLRRGVKKLADEGWILTKVMKVEGKPTCHYQIGRFLSTKMADSMETTKMAVSLNKQLKNNTKPSDFSVGAELSSDPTATAPAHVTELLEKIIGIINPKEKVIKTRITALNARLKEYTSDEITLAARALSQSEWHMENKQMSVDNLLAPSKFGRWFTKGQELSASDLPLDRAEIDAKLAKERKELDEANKNRDWGFGDEPK